MISILTHKCITQTYCSSQNQQNCWQRITLCVLEVLGVGAGVALYFTGVGAIPSICVGGGTFFIMEAINAVSMKWKKFPEPEEIRSQEQPQIYQVAEDSLLQIYDHLSIEDLESCMKTSKYFQYLGQKALIRRAKHFGYKGEQYREARMYLIELLDCVKKLAHTRYLSNRYLEYVSKNLSCGLSSSDSEEFTTQILGFSAEVNGQRPFTRLKSTRDASKITEAEGVKPKTQVKNKLDSEATLNHLFSLSGNAQAFLKEQLNEALIEYIEKNDVKMVRGLIHLGADVNALIQKPLIAASKKGNYHIIQTLLEAGANPRVIDRKGMTPLCLNTSNPKITTLLLQFESDPQYQIPTSGKQALDFSLERGHIKSAHILRGYKNGEANVL